MTIEEAKIVLQSKGLPFIYEWTDAAGVEYKEHQHKGKVSFFVMEGDLVMHFDGKEMHLKKGDIFDVPTGIKHTAKVGPNGCKFLVGEEIEGDS